MGRNENELSAHWNQWQVILNANEPAAPRRNGMVDITRATTVREDTKSIKPSSGRGHYPERPNIMCKRLWSPGLCGCLSVEHRWIDLGSGETLPERHSNGFGHRNPSNHRKFIPSLFLLSLLHLSPVVSLCQERGPCSTNNMKSN